jgi:RHS repeat-associated protein
MALLVHALAPDEVVTMMKINGLRRIPQWRAHRWAGPFFGRLATRYGRKVRFLAAALVLVLIASMLTVSGRQPHRLAGPPVVAKGALLGCGVAGPDGVTPAAAGAGSGSAGAPAARVPAYQALVGPHPAGTAPATVTFAGARVVVGPDAVAAPVAIGVTPLSDTDLPRLDTGMTNVTPRATRGWRFTPHPFHFLKPVEVRLPYDPGLVGSTFSPQDVYTYYFDDQNSCWRPLDRVSVDERDHVVVSRTDHFTVMVNATVTVPDHPDQTSFNPTQIKDIQAAGPGDGVNLIEPPQPGTTGTARLSYPLDLPFGRNGVQPQLAVQYDSGATNADGWLGVGWDLPLPAITVDTRWGVPRYNAALETETYLLGGEQLTPVAGRTSFVPRAAERVFHPRVEGSFAKIIRHGTTPANYTWEIVDKAGTHSFYGGAADSTLVDDTGDVFEWALRGVRDAHGNTIVYHTVRQDDPGLASGGSVPGHNLYLRQITYTGTDTAEGHFAVTFVRDRDLNEPRRADVAIDARGGFKRVTADLLRRVDVTLDGLPVRRYEFSYTTGAFGKTLLSSVAQFGEDNTLFNKHTFTYFDDVRNSAGGYLAFRPMTWTSPSDDLANGAVDAVSGGAGQAGALNATTSTSVGGHLYVGFGVGPTKSGSVGVKTGFGNTEDTGLLALVDVDGDGLPDKVFTTGGGVAYRKNLGGPGGQPRFSDTVQPLRNLPGILTENSNSLTVGLEGYAAAAAAQLDNVDTFSTTSRYFTDANGDGIADLVDGGTVLFGRVGSDGVPVYGLAADTPVPIGAKPVDTTGVIGDFSAARDREIDSHPLVDTVRRWVAPFDGTVQVTGDVRLVSDTSPQRAAYTKADGVRVSVQHEDTELWSRQIAADDYTPHAPAGVDTVEVKQGDRLYFRVQSGFDGAFDQVAWDPRVSYAGVSDATDVNGLSVYQYQASRDFTLGGQATSVTVPATGTIHLSGGLSKAAATTDDVAAVITLDGQTVFDQTMPADHTGNIPVDLDVPVRQGQQLKWRVRVDSPIDLGQISWTPQATYTAAQGVARLTDPAGNPALNVAPGYDVDMYPADGLTAPQQAYTAPADGTLMVNPALTFDFGDQHPNARVVFTVKRPGVEHSGALAAKRVIDITDGHLPSDLGLAVPVHAGDQLYFDFSTLNTTLAAHLTGASVQVGFDTATMSEAPSALHSATDVGAFPQPYRGWGLVGYNGNRDRASQPIVQGDLVVNADYRGQLPSTVDPPAQKDAFAADPRVTPPKFVPFGPVPAANRWQASDAMWAAAGTASSSRLGAPAIDIPAASDLAGAVAVPRLSRSTQVSLTGSVGGGVVSVGGSVATGDSTSQLDYVDMNGDGFPDVVGAGGVQYTDPTGQLGTTRGALPDGAVRATGTTTGNAGAGSAARAITTGRGYAAPPAHTTAGTAQVGNDMPPLGIGGSLGSGTSTGRFDLLDINGDGLPDRVYADGRVALNLGYRFAAPEPWSGAGLGDGSTSTSGLNIGFNTDFYGLAGGASFGSARSSAASGLIDVNGDGLADRVFDGNPIQVALNTGSGFAPPQPFLGGRPGVNADVNAQLGGGAYAEFPVCAVVIAGCVITNPGTNFSTGVGRTEQVLRDIDGDGYPDQLQSTSDGQLAVAENTTGRTNLLKSVSRPLGSRIDLDYTRDGNTYELPQSRWVLSRVTVDDGHPGDGQDVQLTTYRYGGGAYDRLEREFRGYHSVVAEQRDPAAPGAAVYRTVTREYATGSHYTRGLPTRILTADAAGHPFTETRQTYQLRDVFAPSGAADPASTTATIFPQLVRTDQLSFEGQATAGKSTHTEMSYDSVGNLVRTLDAGDAGPGDDVDTLTRYTAEDSTCQANNIVGTPKAVDIRGDGVVSRHRESTVDCKTGNVTQQRAMLGDGTTAVTDLTYFGNGDLQTVTEPPNSTRQRYSLIYEYDPELATHVTATTDSFGYRSTATYNLKYGKTVSTTDVNGQVVRYDYDAYGRTHMVTGPYQTASNHPTIDVEYHPEATVPYAITRNVDVNSDGSIRTDSIDTVTFTDGLKRVVQTKKDATLSTGPGASPVDAMTVSGHTVYDFAGRVVTQYYPTSEPKSFTNTVFNPAVDTVAPTRTSYDVLDRATQVVMPDNTTTTTAYGFGPDRSGATQFETAVTDANGNITRTYTDIRGNTIAVRQANPAGGQPVIWTSYAYDPLGELTAVVDDHNNTTTASYDNFGRRTAVANPDTGKTQTVYDLASNPVKEITANLAAQHRAIAYDYDFNRLTAVRYPNSSDDNVTYAYGAPGAANNGADRIVKVTDAAGTLSRGYGPLGEITSETRTVAGPGRNAKYTTTYRYDTWNRVQQLTYPDGEVLSYHYNSGGLVDSATGVKGSFSYPYVTQVNYDQFDQRVLMRYGNGTSTTYAYNAADRRLATLQATQPGGTPFQNLNYGYDNVGNVTSVADSAVPSGPTGGANTQTFGYDSLNRLVTAQGQEQLAAGRTNQYQLTMAYDSIDNVTAKNQNNTIATGSTTTPQAATTYQYGYSYAGTGPHAPSQVGPLKLRYDADGNLVSRTAAGDPSQLLQLSWSDADRVACSRGGGSSGDGASLVALDTSSCGTRDTDVRYTYDDQGNRVVKDGGSHNLSIYPSPTYSLHNQTAFKHIFIGDTRLVSKLVEPASYPENNQFYFHPDALGSTAYGSDNTGKVVDHQLYFPSGETWVDEHTVAPTPYQFTGKELDPETNLYDFGARYYDARTGLWQSPDPSFDSQLDGSDGGGVAAPVDLATYTYAQNNPVRLADPNGKEAITVSMLLAYAAYTLLAVATVAAFDYGVHRTQQLLRSRSESSNDAAQSDVLESRAKAAAPPASGGGAQLPPPPPIAVPNGTGATGSGVGTGANTTTQARTNDEDGLVLTLKMRADWTPAQRAAAERKVAAINRAAQTPPGVFVTRVNRPSISPRTMKRDDLGITQAEFDELYGDFDIDHEIDLQLGGAHAAANLVPLDPSVNRSFGAQINRQTQGRVGARVTGVNLIERAGGP